MRSVDYDWYEYQIYKCSYITDADALMDEAAEDKSISPAEYIALCLFVRNLIVEGKLI